MRDGTAGTAQVAAAYLRHVAAATGKADDVSMLGRAVMRVDVAEGDRLLRTALAQAIADGDHGLATTVAWDLVILCRGLGRLGEALELAGQAVDYSRRAGLGRWTQLADQTRRLQIVFLLGQPDQVLAEVRRLITVMDQLPTQRDADDMVEPFNVREGLLNLGVIAANSLEQWQEALELNAGAVASLRARSAGEHAIAVAAFGDYLPLIRLGRLEDAEHLLLSCQQVHEQRQDTTRLAKTFTARADLASARGHLEEAIDLAHAAIRLQYTSPDPTDIAVAHFNLGLYLNLADTDPGGQLAHCLAAAVIRQLTGQTHQLTGALRALAGHLRELSGTAPPTTLADLIATVERVEGVRFAELTGALAGDPGAAQDALDAVLHAARNLSTDQVSDVQSHLDQWEPALAVLVAAVRGDQDAAASIDELLTRTAASQDWAGLTAALRRILDGDRDFDTLTAGLDKIDTAITTAVLTRLTDPAATD